MRNQAIISLIALAAFAKANPDCLTSISSTGSIVDQFASHVKSFDLASLKNDFSSLEKAVNSVNDSCSPIITPSAMGTTATLIQDCQALLIDMATNLSEFENKPVHFNTDILKALKYLASRSHIFATLCQEQTTPVVQPREFKEEVKPVEQPLPYQGVVDYTAKQETAKEEPTPIVEGETWGDPYDLTPEQMKVLDEILQQTPSGYIDITDKVNTTVIPPARLPEEALSNMIIDISDKVDTTVTPPERLPEEVLSHMITEKTEEASDDQDLEGLKETLNKFINRKDEVPTAETQPENPMAKFAREIQAAMAKQVVPEQKQEETATVETEEVPEEGNEMSKMVEEIQKAIAQAQESQEKITTVEVPKSQDAPTVTATPALKRTDAPTTTQGAPTVTATPALKRTEESPVSSTEKTEKSANAISGLITGIFDNIRKENEQKTQEIPVEELQQKDQEEEQAPDAKSFESTNTEVPEPVETKDTPQPQCLSQIYQSFATLYSFGADAEAQDVAQLQADYEALKQLANAINNFCHPKVVFNTPKPTAGNCSADFSSIATIVSNYKSNDPSDYNNVINTVQSLWDTQSSFIADCVETKKEEPVVVPQQPIVDTKETVETINAVELKNCDTMYIEAVKVIYQLQEDSATEDLNQLVADYAALKEAVSGINLYCEKDLRVNMFARRPKAPEACAQHFVELRELTSTSMVNKMEDLSTLVQNVWGMASSFLQDC